MNRPLRLPSAGGLALAGLFACFQLFQEPGARAQGAIREQKQAPSASADATALPQNPAVMRAQILLTQLLARAFAEDPSLNRQLAAFEQALENAMVALDPQTTRRLARMAELEALYNDVVARDRSPDIEALLEESFRLQGELEVTARTARRQAAVAAQADALVSALRAGVGDLASIDPALAQLVSSTDLLIDLVTIARLAGRERPSDRRRP